MQKIHLLRLENTSIFEQLQIEEALLRVDEENWCLINQGSSPAIVMGISGKPEQLINQSLVQKFPIPLIKRFSGGGTVVVDQNTYFVTFICNSADLQVPSYPSHVFQWSTGLYQSIFKGFDFQFLENDYAFGNKKFGGNAQYMRKNRWLHHSSLLWDFNPEQMNYLLMPQKKPNYREDRSHKDFLCRLSDFLPNQLFLEKRLLEELDHRYHVEEKSFESLENILNAPHRKATVYLR